jgi:integrase
MPFIRKHHEADQILDCAIFRIVALSLMLAKEHYGADIRFIQSLLSHSKLNTTQILHTSEFRNVTQDPQTNAFRCVGA